MTSVPFFVFPNGDIEVGNTTNTHAHVMKDYMSRTGLGWDALENAITGRYDEDTGEWEIYDIGHSLTEEQKAIILDKIGELQYEGTIPTNINPQLRNDFRSKVAAGGPMVPANYTPDDPLDLQGKQPLFDAMDTQWWTLPPQEGERAVVNAFRATMLSPRMNLKGNAVLYQSLMNVDPHESDPNVFEGIIRDLKTRWDAQGQTGLGDDPTDVMSVDSILPGKFQPGIWTNIRRIAALGPYADEIYKAAMTDVQQYGGTGQYFRNRILQLNIPGVKAKVASFAWLALAPNSSELGTIDVHMMRHLGEDADSPRNTTHYMQLEDQLRQERDDTYGPDTPLSKYQWGVWDKRRTPGFHQDHSPLRPIDPTPYTDVYWAPQPRPPRDMQPQETDPNQMSLMSKVGWSIMPKQIQWVKPEQRYDFDNFVRDVIEATGFNYYRSDAASIQAYQDQVLRITQGLIPAGDPNARKNRLNPFPYERTKPDTSQRENYANGLQYVVSQMPELLQNKIPNQDARQQMDQEHADQFYNGILPNDPKMRAQYPRQQQTAKWSFVRLGGHSLKGNIVVGGSGIAQGVALRLDQQTPDEIMAVLDQLPTHEQDYQKQKELIPSWQINRGGKVADIRMNPDGTGVTYAPGAIVVAEWVDVEDNWILYHGNVTGIVAGKGGGTSHGVQVALERNIPIIVDVEGWDTIQAGDTLQMDAASGIIEVNGGGTQDLGEAQQADDPVIAFVWSQGNGRYLPVPAGSAGAASLHREMIAEMRHAQQFNKRDYAMGVVYADGRIQQVGETSDDEAMKQWIEQILPTNTNEPAFTG